MNRILLSFLLLTSTSLVAKPIKPTKKPSSTPVAKPLPAAEVTPPQKTVPEIKSVETPAKEPTAPLDEKKMTPDLFPLDGILTSIGPHNLYLLNPGLTVDTGVFYISLKSNSKTNYPTEESKFKLDMNVIGQKAFVGYRSQNLPFTAGLGLYRLEKNYKLSHNYSDINSDSSGYSGRDYGVFPTFGIVLQNGFYSMLGLEHKTSDHEESSKTDARPTLSIGYAIERLNLGLSHAVSKSRGSGEDKDIVLFESQKLHTLYWLSPSLGLDFNLHKIKFSDNNTGDETRYQDSYSVYLGVDLKDSHSYYSFDIFESTPYSKKVSDKAALGQFYTSYGVVAEGKWKVASLYDLGLRGSYLQGSGKRTYQESDGEVTENEGDSSLVLELTCGLTF